MLKSRWTTPNTVEDGEQPELTLAGGSVKCYNHLKNLQFPIQLNVHLPYDPEILLLGIHPREMYTYLQKRLQKINSNSIHNSLKQETTQISTGKWINKLPCLRITDYGSGIKRNKLPMYTTMWMNL